MTPDRKKMTLAESLLEEGLITHKQLEDAHKEEKKTGDKLRTVLVKLGFIDENDLVSFLSGKLGLPKVDLSNYMIEPELLDLIPEDLARKHEVVPLFKIGKRLTCAMYDPWDVFALDEIRMKTKMDIEPAIAAESEIKKVINDHYGSKGSMEEVIKHIEGEGDTEITEGMKEETVKDLEISAERPAVIRIVNSMIMEAMNENASDIHIEPEEKKLMTRFRVDGMLHEASSPPKHLQAAIISRIKIMSNLNIAERRKPQDGRFSVRMHGKEVDVRVSCIPTIHGENIVLRLLDVSSALLNLTDLGFSEEVTKAYDALIHRPNGIILVTGPTGSGKTTSLYASLNKINTEEKNIITIEDPVEYRLPGIRQIQVNPKVNLVFSTGLRSILRQDPDIIMVGEMRDFETAEVAIQAALTGHLVFSTLHTNDAAGAITRMVDMGIKPFLVASSIIGILAQRLVRKVCVKCKQEYKPTEKVLKSIGIDPSQAGRMEFARGKGCKLCGHTGYRGRVGLGELLVVDDEIRDLILAKVASHELEAKAVSKGMVTLTASGLEKAKEGITTIEEALRVTLEE